ncbi:hypothetical protein CCYA_CCYA06G1721 [Cyanidiococcus yangmingshanensis]|nr:hypothetical protein CCYA_CCYA06G1721 [Cyanidiococcus yangmingshanensis]
MTLDRTGTNWHPWPAVARLPKTVQILGGVGLSLVFAYTMVGFSRRLGSTPRTTEEDWKAETEKRALSKEREAGEPTVLNPISRSFK